VADRPAFSLRPLADTVLGGKYAINKKHLVMVLLPALHRDQFLGGPHPEVFNPDNFTPEAERKLPAGAYKPFGNGQRSCIGRQFAMQEAILVLAMVLHRFTLIDHKGYRLKLKETLTMKPEGFTIRVRPRTDERKTARQTASTLSPGGESTGGEADQTRGATAAISARHGTPLLVLYGSNLGTAEDLALQIAREGEAQGYAVTAGALDEFVGKLPADGGVIIVTASYNGTPPDNAADFCKWLTNGRLAADALRGVNYSVFGLRESRLGRHFSGHPAAVRRATRCARRAPPEPSRRGRRSR
jgi:cytochrome P450/NADPH-cytochrome P450 reductase